NEDWAIADIVVGIAGWVVPGWGEISTLKDLELAVKFVQKAANLPGVLEGILETLDRSPTCTKVPTNQARSCLDETYDDLFDPSFWGMLFDAETVQVVVITDTRTVRFTTNP